MINEFRGRYRFLSNFYPCEIRYEGLVFSSVEHAYQAAKSDCREVRLLITSCVTAGAAKKCGKLLVLRPDWSTNKTKVMLELLRIKFQDSFLAQSLLNTTDDGELAEGNNWHDNFWGMCGCPICYGRGKNMLGRLLMTVRNDIADVLRRANSETQ
jgi:ribA/ribD-fused uncharacterized protein